MRRSPVCHFGHQFVGKDGIKSKPDIHKMLSSITPVRHKVGQGSVVVILYSVDQFTL